RDDTTPMPSIRLTVTGSRASRRRAARSTARVLRLTLGIGLAGVSLAVTTLAAAGPLQPSRFPRAKAPQVSANRAAATMRLFSPESVWNAPVERASLDETSAPRMAAL